MYCLSRLYNLSMCGQCRLYNLSMYYLCRLYNLSLSSYYMTEEGEDSPFICSAARENGMLRCHDVPPYSEGGTECSLSAPPPGPALFGSSHTAQEGCVNWNQYYNVCHTGDINPHKGAVNFDNIAYAWIAIFQVQQEVMSDRK